MQRHRGETRDGNYVSVPLHELVDDRSGDGGWKKLTAKKETMVKPCGQEMIMAKLWLAGRFFLEREDHPWLKMMENNSCTIEERSCMQQLGDGPYREGGEMDKSSRPKQY